MRHLFLIVILASLASCAPRVSDRSITIDYKHGHFHEAEYALTERMEEEMPGGDFKKSGDAVWLLLDRAMVRFVNGDTSQSIADFKQGLEAIDFYNQELFVETVAQILGQDSNAAYCGEDFEQALARLYFALALLHQGENAMLLLFCGKPKS